jgi:MFS family permease
MGLLSISARREAQGATLGLTQSAGTLARVVGPILATSLYAVSPHSAFLFAAAVAAVAALIAWRFLLGPEDNDQPPAAP